VLHDWNRVASCTTGISYDELGRGATALGERARGRSEHPLVSVDGIWAKLEYLARDRGHRRRLREEHPELATVVTVFSDEGAFRDGDPA